MNLEDKQNELKELIKKSNIFELKNYFEKNIKYERFNSYNELLLYSIENNVSNNIIEYIIKLGQLKNLNFYIPFDNINKVPLFIAIANNNFRLSNLLLKYNADINYKINNQNVIEYLLEYNLLITDINLKYILNKFNRKNITINLIFKLIEKKQNDVLRIIINFYKNISTSSILNTFLIGIYKNKIRLSDRQLKYTL